MGDYGGRRVPFLGLPDLIRSKETERDGDWADVAALEQFLDARHLAAWRAGAIAAGAALASFRSRAGLEGRLAAGLLSDLPAVGRGLAAAVNPVTRAFLAPYATGGLGGAETEIEPVIARRLATVAGASPLHLSLVEIVRRRYIARRKAEDRADKQAALAAAGAG